MEKLFHQFTTGLIPNYDKVSIVFTDTTITLTEAHTVNVFDRVDDALNYMLAFHLFEFDPAMKARLGIL